MVDKKIFCVYVIGNDCDYVKIGESYWIKDNPMFVAREKQMNTAGLTHSLYRFNCSSKEDARKLETRIHCHVDELRKPLTTEIFFTNPALFVFLEQLKLINSYNYLVRPAMYNSLFKIPFSSEKILVSWTAKGILTKYVSNIITKELFGSKGKKQFDIENKFQFTWPPNLGQKKSSLTEDQYNKKLLDKNLNFEGYTS